MVVFMCLSLPHLVRDVNNRIRGTASAYEKPTRYVAASVFVPGRMSLWAASRWGVFIVLREGSGAVRFRDGLTLSGCFRSRLGEIGVVFQVVSVDVLGVSPVEKADAVRDGVQLSQDARGIKGQV